MLTKEDKLRIRRASENLAAWYLEAKAKRGDRRAEIDRKLSSLDVDEIREGLEMALQERGIRL